MRPRPLSQYAPDDQLDSEPHCSPAAHVRACSPALGVRVVCEQVSHHPPMSAFHCESALEQLPFTLDGHVQPRSLLLGRVLVAQPRGVMTLQLHTCAD